jgi:hypothetical protein
MQGREGSLMQGRKVAPWRVEGSLMQIREAASCRSGKQPHAGQESSLMEAHGGSLMEGREVASCKVRRHPHGSRGCLLDKAKR